MPKGTAPLMLCNVTEHPSDSHCADIVPDEPLDNVAIGRHFLSIRVAAPLIEGRRNTPARIKDSIRQVPAQQRGRFEPSSQLLVDALILADLVAYNATTSATF